MTSPRDSSKKNKKKRGFFKTLMCTSSTADDRHDHLDPPLPKTDDDEAHERPLSMLPANGKAVAEKDKRAAASVGKRGEKKPAKGKANAKHTGGAKPVDKKPRQDKADAKRTSDASPVIRQSPSGNPVIKQSPSGKPVIKQSPSGNPGNKQSPSGSPGYKQSPSGNPGNKHSPSGSPGNKQSPSGNPVIKQSPSGNPGNKQSPSGNPVIKQSPSGNPGNKQLTSDRSVSRQQPESKQLARVIPDIAQAARADANFKHRASQKATDGQSGTEVPESRQEIRTNASKSSGQTEVVQRKGENNITLTAPTNYRIGPKAGEKFDSVGNNREKESSVYRTQKTSESPRNVTKGKHNNGTMETSTASLKGGIEKTQAKDNITSYSNAAKILNSNLLFYQGRLRCRPDNVFIDEIHRDWYDEMELLERKHGYIQWLFPISESQGMNSQAQALQPHEAAALKQDAQAMTRFLTSYKMMLSFYGMKLADIDTGQVERAANWRERFRNLNNSSHNHLRVTRILKCLGELGLERYKYPLLEFLVHEVIGTGELNKAAKSCEEYWMETEEDSRLRQMLRQRYYGLKQGVDQRDKAERDSRMNKVDSKVKKTSIPSNNTRSEFLKDCSEENQTVEKLPSRDPQPKMGSHDVTVCLPDSDQKEASYAVRLVAGNPPTTTRATDSALTIERDRDKTSDVKTTADSESGAAATTRARQDYSARNSGHVEAAPITLDRAAHSQLNPLGTAENRPMLHLAYKTNSGARVPDEFYDSQRSAGNHRNHQAMHEVRSASQTRGVYYPYTRAKPKLNSDPIGLGPPVSLPHSGQGRGRTWVEYRPDGTRVFSRAQTLPLAPTQRHERSPSASTMPGQMILRPISSNPKGKSKPPRRR